MKRFKFPRMLAFVGGILITAGGCDVPTAPEAAEAEQRGYVFAEMAFNVIDQDANGAFVHQVGDDPVLWSRSWLYGDEGKSGPFYELLGSDDHSHLIGSNMGFGLEPGGLVRVSFKFSAVNGVTEKPLTYTVGVDYELYHLAPNQEQWQLVRRAFLPAQIDTDGRSFIELSAPTIPGRYSVMTIAGAKIERCNAIGRKQVLVERVRYETTDMIMQRGGAGHYAMTCTEKLASIPDYSLEAVHGVPQAGSTGTGFDYLFPDGTVRRVTSFPPR